MRTTLAKRRIPDRPLICGPFSQPVAASGSSLAVHEWTMSGPSYLHVHLHDDEAWHVLEGVLTFRFADGEVEAPSGTTVFVPAGVAHTYRAAEGSRYLIFLTPKLDRLIAKLLGSPAGISDAELRGILAEFDTKIAE
jgi:quercetin dioxygenase-like cupin family protein